MKQTNKQRVKILTNSGYKYIGFKLGQENGFIKIRDERQGIIKVPLVNISFMKELNSKKDIK